MGLSDLDLQFSGLSIVDPGGDELHLLRQGSRRIVTVVEAAPPPVERLRQALHILIGRPASAMIVLDAEESTALAARLIDNGTTTPRIREERGE